MQKVLNVFKPMGKTPLEAIDQARKVYPRLKNEKIAYAGRLDPMAEGVLLLLTGDECKRRKSYERLDKAYEFEAIFGLTSDSYDILGIVRQGKQITQSELTDALEEKMGQFIGKNLQKYPPYSAVRVQGRPLFYWARENKIKQIKVPEKEITIYDLKLESLREIEAQALFENVCRKIQKVEGDFRQKDVLESWESILKDNFQSFPIVSMKVKCTSGTYVRGLVHDLGRKSGTGALTLSIKRTSVGDYKLKDSTELF